MDNDRIEVRYRGNKNVASKLHVESSVLRFISCNSNHTDETTLLVSLMKPRGQNVYERIILLIKIVYQY